MQKTTLNLDGWIMGVASQCSMVNVTGDLQNVRRFTYNEHE